jgi:hypothetical protein
VEKVTRISAVFFFHIFFRDLAVLLLREIREYFNLLCFTAEAERREHNGYNGYNWGSPSARLFG